MSTRELNLGMNLNLARLHRAAHQDRSTTPFYSSRIGIDAGIANDFALTLQGKADILFSQTANMTVIIGHFGYHNHKVAAISHQRFAHLINIKTEFGAAAGRHALVGTNHLTILVSLCYHHYHLRRFLLITVFASLPEIPGILEYHRGIKGGCRRMKNWQSIGMGTLIGGKTNAVTIREYRNIGIAELGHLMSDMHKWLVAAL